MPQLISKNAYGASSITVLEGLEAVRKPILTGLVAVSRPDMSTNPPPAARG